MAAKPNEPDLSELTTLVDHARLLLKKFVSLPLAEREQARGLVSELEQVIVEFKRRCPPPLARSRPHLRVIDPGWVPLDCSFCALEINPAERFMKDQQSAFHERCLPHCLYCGKQISVENCAPLLHGSSIDTWRGRHIICPEE